MANVPTVKLRSGTEMPVLGFGVYQIRDLDECEQSVYDALMAGYRSIDTAAIYGNEEAVGKAIKRSGVPREELFITSKLWVQDATYEDAKVKAIGVSNLTSDRLVDLTLNNKIAPMVNQIEIHPFNQQAEAIKVMREYDVQPEGWAPFAEGKQDLFTNEVLAGIAKQYNKTVAQVALRWSIQRGVVAIPKSTHKERIIENFDIFDFELTDEDMKKIGSLDESKGLFVVHQDPEFIKQLHERKIHD